jgi:hypothetical protein
VKVCFLLEECLVNLGSFENDFFCLVGGLGKILTIDNLMKLHAIGPSSFFFFYEY